MGNIPRIPFHEIHLTPGNVLIEVLGDYTKRNAARNSDGDNGLIHGRVVRVGPSIRSPFGCSQCQCRGDDRASNYAVQQGDEVWVRTRNGFPVRLENEKKLFVFNEWDVAIKIDRGLGQQQTTSARAPRYHPNDQKSSEFYH